LRAQPTQLPMQFLLEHLPGGWIIRGVRCAAVGHSLIIDMTCRRRKHTRSNEKGSIVQSSCSEGARFYA
jgi:hypothetical protein